MIDLLARRLPVEDAKRDEVLTRLDETHKAWMRAGEGIVGVTRVSPAH